MPSHKLEFHPFTEKALKESKSISRKKGDSYESFLSILFHSKFEALLISPKLLREFGCGQIDIAYLTATEVHLVEVKSGKSQISFAQLQRLKLSQEFINHLFKLTVKLKIINQLPK